MGSRTQQAKRSKCRTENKSINKNTHISQCHSCMQHGHWPKRKSKPHIPAVHGPRPFRHSRKHWQSHGRVLGISCTYYSAQIKYKRQEQYRPDTRELTRIKCKHGKQQSIELPYASRTAILHKLIIMYQVLHNSEKMPDI